ncbi:MAG TPA: hypothetical protein VFX43_19520 [Chitinophagaceae bacterium]|nr:hypothetical protein [Chitinophagaceae bacterium]
MKKILITILLCSCIGIPAVMAQRKTFLKVNPTTLVNELDVYIGKEISPSLSLEVGGGFVYTDYWDNILNQFDFGQIKPNISEHQYLNAKGFSGRLGLRFYVISPYAANSKARGTYFEPLLLYKEVWYPHDDKELDSKNYIEKGRKYVMGMQLLVGRQYKRKKIYIDKYIGLGVKAKTYSFDNFQVNQGSGNVQNNGQRTTSWLPDIKLGVKIAFDLSHH